MEKQNEIEINTRLGVRTVDKEKFIYFPRGLAGFEGLHEFILLQIRPEVPFLILQSLDNEHVGLLVAEPSGFIQDYTVKMVEAEEKLLRIKPEDEMTTLVTVSIPEGKPEEISLNLTGPILINNERKIGLQVPQSDSSLPTQFYLYQVGQEMQAQQAGADGEKEKSSKADADEQVVNIQENTEQTIQKQDDAACALHDTAEPLLNQVPELSAENAIKETQA